MKLLRALWLLLESITLLLVLLLREQIRKARYRMKKVKIISGKRQKSDTSLLGKAKPAEGVAEAKGVKPPFPPLKMRGKNNLGNELVPREEAERITLEKTGDASPVDPRDVKTCAAVLDLPFRAAHLAWKDVQPLTTEEIEYMAEPLAEIFVELDWMDKLRGPYIKLGYGLSIAVVSRVRAHAAVKAATAKEKEKAAKQEAGAKSGAGVAGSSSPGTGPVFK